MKIRHERPMSELAYDVRAPLRLELPDGTEIVVSEWSLEGLSLPSPVDILPTTAQLIIPFQGVDIRFPVNFQKGAGDRRLNFVGLSGRQRETLAVFYRSLLSGRMASTDDVITSLDTPVDLVPMGETDEEEEAGRAKSSSRSIRAVISLSIYALVAIAVFGLLGNQIWSKLNVVTLSNGFVSAPVTAHVARESAYVERILVEPGQTVQAGQPLVRLSDPERDHDVDRIRVDIIQAERRYDEAVEDLNLYNQRLETREADLLEAHRTLQRALPLIGYYGEVEDQALRAAWAALVDFRTQRADPLGTYQADLKRKQQVLEEREKEFRFLKRELSNKKGAARSLDIVATHDGVVENIFVIEDQFAQRGERVINIEADEMRTAVGWLSDQRADSVYVGMPAKIRFNRGAGRQFVDGRITNLVSGVHPNAPDLYGMIVTVTPNEMDVSEIRDVFFPNAPIRIQLSREILAGVWKD